MDYEFFDDTRTRFQVQSGPFNPNVEIREINRKQVALCIGIAILLLSYAWTLEGLLQFFLAWLGLAMLVGPFAPVSLTGGDCRVGLGERLPEETQEDIVETETDKRTFRQNRKARNGENPEKVQVWLPEKEIFPNGESMEILPSDLLESEGKHNSGSVFVDSNRANSNTEAEWTLEEVDLLRKQMIKYPRGKLKRWEVIAEAFGGTHSVESVVKMSKTFGEKRSGDNDSFSKFLAQRKGSAKAIASPLSERWDSDGTTVENDGSNDPDKNKASDDFLDGDGLKKQEEEKQRKDWTEVEDKALLTALKTFPKDTPMRWEKVAVAVPGKTKAQCFRHFAELREVFRSNKADKSNKLQEFD